MPLSAAAAGLIGTGISSAINFASQAHTNAMNKRMSEDAYRKQTEAIKRQNEYNSPSMQVARLKAAGLSANLAYGGSGELTGQQSEIPEYNPIAAESPSVPDVGNTVFEAAKLGLDQREQRNRDLLAQAELSVKDAQSYMYMMSGDYDAALAERTAVLLGFDVEQSAKNIELTQQNIEESKKRIEEIEQNIAESASRVGLNEAQVRELAVRVNLHEAEVIRIMELLPHEVQKMDSEACLNWAKSAEAKASCNLIANKVIDMAYYRTLDAEKFDWSKKEYGWDLQVKNEELKQHKADQITNAITKVIGIGIGAAAMRNNQSLPPSKSTVREVFNAKGKYTGGYTQHESYSE